jgi:hypothetical protein
MARVTICDMCKEKAQNGPVFDYHYPIKDNEYKEGSGETITLSLLTNRQRLDLCRKHQLEIIVKILRYNGFYIPHYHE